MKNLFFGSLFTFLYLTVFPTLFVVSAQLSGINDPTGNSGQNSLGDYITAGLGIVFGLVALFAVVMFSIGGLRYLTSRGDQKAAEAARGTMTGSVIGLIIVLGAASLSGVFERIFGISLFGGENTPAPIDSANNSFQLECAFQVVTGCIGQDQRYQNFGALITQVLLALLAIGALAFFFMLLWGGIRYMISRGDEKAVSEARNSLTNSVVGLLLMISALVIIRLIAGRLFGVNV